MTCGGTVNPAGPLVRQSYPLCHTNSAQASGLPTHAGAGGPLAQRHQNTHTKAVICCFIESILQRNTGPPLSSIKGMRGRQAEEEVQDQQGMRSCQKVMRGI